MTEKEILEAVRACARGEEPKSDIGELLRAHRCYPLINRKEKEQTLMERVVNLAALKERYRACAPFFQKADFPYAVVKGAVLSAVAYGDSLLRVSGDVDILIRRQDADAAKRLLQGCGFIQGRVTDGGIVPFSRKEILYQTAVSHQTAPYVRKTESPICPYVNVDVNMDILWGECERHSNMEAVLAEREPFRLFDVDFYKLQPEMEFVALCLHHYKDMNSLYLLSEGSLCLGLFCDIYFYIRNAKPSAARLVELCAKLDVGRFVYVCLAHTMEIFDEPLLLPYLEALEGMRDECLLDSFGLNDGERHTWDLSLTERVLCPDLPTHIWSLLSEKDREKIRINRENM